MLLDLNLKLLGSLSNFLVKLKDEQYQQKLELLEGNSIGKHLRHILDFYQVLLKYKQDTTINYSSRERDKEIESSTKCALDKIKSIEQSLNQIDLNQTINVEFCSRGINKTLKSNLERELLFNLDHCTHHMAIIRIAVKHYFPNIEICQNFGIAESTQTHYKT